MSLTKAEILQALSEGKIVEVQSKSNRSGFYQIITNKELVFNLNIESFNKCNWRIKEINSGEEE